MAVQTTISPATGKPVVERTLPSDAELESSVQRAREAFTSWRRTPLDERRAILHKAVDLIVARADELAKEISEQMGRPVSSCKGEIAGFEDRARWLLDYGSKALEDESVDEGRPDGFKRVIRRAPLGVCFLIGAWNFPYLIQVNALIPSLLAGNTVLLKPSPQTPLCSERIASALTEAGLPKGVCQVLHLSAEQMDRVVAHPQVNFVSFTGSVANGFRVEKTSSQSPTLKNVALELGGKDAAYVREDVDPAWAAENVVDGAFFNSGQSCCAIERVYVHESIYDHFVDAVVKEVKNYKLGDPSDPSTSLGPVVSTRSAATIREHIRDALAKGGKALIDEALFPASKEGTAFVAPQVLVDVTHEMKAMSEETFGPLVGIMKVKSDDEALTLMNDSRYGLTASVWTKSTDAFNALVDEIESGTVYMNRCDYLDPALPWTGVKESGRGASLSHIGFEAVTRPKSIMVRL